MGPEEFRNWDNASEELSLHVQEVGIGDIFFENAALVAKIRQIIREELDAYLGGKDDKEEG